MRSSERGGVGRVLSFAYLQHRRAFGKNQRVESFPASAGGKEALPEAFGVEFGFGISSARLIHSGVG